MSDTPPEFDELEGSGLAEGSGMFEGSGLFEASGDDGEGSGFGEGGEEDEEDVPIYYYLEESTGYMQPTLSFLAILHTVISFICIIGYNCLKVRQQRWGKKSGTTKKFPQSISDVIEPYVLFAGVCELYVYEAKDQAKRP